MAAPAVAMVQPPGPKRINEADLVIIKELGSSPCSLSLFLCRKKESGCNRTVCVCVCARVCVCVCMFVYVYVVMCVFV